MKKTALSIGIAAAFMVGGSATMAGSISNGDLNSFTGGEKALASEVNDNFQAVKKEVNDNDIRITANQGAIAGVVDGKADASALTDGLALKADASALTDGLALKADASALTDGLALKADASALTDGLALKADASALTDGLALKADASALTGGLDAANSDIGALEASVYGVGGTPTVPTSPSLMDDVATLKAGGGCPDEMVSVGSICFDKTEYFENGLVKVNVSQREALKLCAVAGKRLPTDAEWSMAAENDGSALGIVNMAGGVYEWVADWTGGDQGLLRGNGNSAVADDININIVWKFAGNGGSDGGGPNGVIGFRCAK